MTIVPIGKEIVQEPNGEASGYWAKLDQQIQGMVRSVVGRCVEAMLFGEVDRQLQRKRHQRRACMWGDMHSQMKS